MNVVASQRNNTSKQNFGFFNCKGGHESSVHGQRMYRGSELGALFQSESHDELAVSLEVELFPRSSPFVCFVLLHPSILHY